MKDDHRDSIVSPRLFAVTVTPLLLLLIASGLVLFFVLKMRNAAEQVRHAEAVLTGVADVERQLHQQHVAVLKRLLRGERDGSYASASRETQRALQATRSLLSGSEAQLAQLMEVQANHDRWTREVRTLERLNVRSIEFNEGVDEEQVLLGSTLMALGELEREERRLREQRSKHLAELTDFTVYGALPLLFLLSLVIGVNSRRQVVKLAHDFTDAIRGQSEANHIVELQSWVREQRVRLIGATRGDANFETLGRRFLEELVAATGAELGAFYVLESGFWVRYAGYALGEDKRRTVPLDEGLLGEAKSNTRYRTIENLPENYFHVTSGLGSGTARSLAIVPCHHEEEVLAMVELAYLKSIDERSNSLLEQVGESMGVATAVTRKRVRLRGLLEESRRQAEALQTQQEELRVTNEELSTQSDALKSAHAQLEERKEELEISNSNLVKQRDALKEVQKKLEQRAIELKRANRYKSEFLASMSHELRTPLNSSLILSKILAENRDGNLTPEQIKFAETIHAGGQELLALINDVLELSKIEAGAIELSCSDTKIADLVRPVLRITEPIARDRGLELKVDLGSPDAVIRTDAPRVQQILKNLLSNACKFTPEGSVSLTVELKEKNLVMSVHDTGVGIAEEHWESIFEAFRQADGTTHRRFEGTGLGLSISRDLARRLGGDVTVESKLGVGSCFRLLLPVVPPEAPASSQQTLQSSIEANGDSPSEVNEDPVEPVTASVPEPSSSRSRRLVLVIQADPRFAETIAEVARSLDFECLVVHDAEEGVRMARDHKPSAIVLDVNTKNESGRSVLEQLKNLPETTRIPVHVVAEEEEARAEALSLGAVGHLQKPVDAKALRQTLSKFVERTSSPRRILVVEDDPLHREELQRLLNIPGAEIVMVGTVADALAAVRTNSFECIVTDLGLPDASGHELLRTLASDETYAFPNVIVYTGKELAPDEEQELMRYSDSIIVKGARSPERLLDEVTMFLHQVESTLPQNRRSPPRRRSKEGVFDGKTILLVEDDVRNVFALTSVLERNGMRLVVARNGREALEALERSPDVAMVLMDLMMPEMDGLEATAKIRKLSSPIAKVPIIALTAKAMRDDREACIEAGANDYITKPIDIDKLLSLMKIWMPQ